jgi:hypothetical protein
MSQRTGETVESMMDAHTCGQSSNIRSDVLLEGQHQVGWESLHLDRIRMGTHETVRVQPVNPADMRRLRLGLAYEGVDLVLSLLFLGYLKVLNVSA